METHKVIELKGFKRQFRKQFTLLFLISLVMSFPTCFFSNFLNINHHITEPIIGGVLTFLIVSYMFLNKRTIENLNHKPITILHYISSLTLLFFCLMVISSNGNILKSEISIVFIIYLPIAYYILTKTWIYTYSEYYEVQRPKTNLKLFFVIYVLSFLISCIVFYPLSCTFEGFLPVIGLSIPILFFSLIVREFLI